MALPKDRIEKGLRELAMSATQQSDFERKLFEYFMAAMSLQIQGLELYNRRLDPELKKKLETFSKIITRLKKTAK